MRIPKPARIFDREVEWQNLVEFALDERTAPSLALVYGRRRQGKSFLLTELCRATSGFYHVALEEESAISLRRFGEALATQQGLPGALAFRDWAQAMEGLFGLGRAARPTLAVIDEFPYLVDGDRSVASALQRTIDQTTFRSESRLRLILCGSAISTMTRLLSGSAPLHGRATMTLLIHPFEYRVAAGHWGLRDRPALAFPLHAILGGTPAYRAMLRGSAPTSAKGFNSWVERAVLSPQSPLFTEGRLLLWEEPVVTDRSLYSSVLSAIASGRTRRGEIASFLGRGQSAVNHPLNVLEDLQLIRQEADAFRRNRSTFHIADPVVRFFHAIVRPNLEDLIQGRGSSVWARAKSTTFPSEVLGPHLEEIARYWTRYVASRATLGGLAGHVAPSEVNDAAQRTTHQLDVAALAGDDPSRLLAIGEAKWTSRRIGRAELDRLDRVRAILTAKGLADPRGTRLLLFCGSGGFTQALVRLSSERQDVELVDLERLYGGD